MLHMHFSSLCWSYMLYHVSDLIDLHWSKLKVCDCEVMLSHNMVQCPASGVTHSYVNSLMLDHTVSKSMSRPRRVHHPIFSHPGNWSTRHPPTNIRHLVSCGFRTKYRSMRDNGIRGGDGAEVTTSKKL